MAESIDSRAIRILLFAGLREAAGWSERLWPTCLIPESSAPPTPTTLWNALNLPGNLADCRIAINQRFATVDTPLGPGDELAFLPPISGG